MKILYLSFYFPPDLCAGSFRNGALVDSLIEKLPAGSEVDVLTTLPNRYSGFSADASEYERRGKVSIHRVGLPVHQSGMLDQSRSFTAYACFVRQHVRNKDYDLIFASSSRLMTSALGAWVARKIKAPLYLDIRDIFVDTIKDVLPRKLVWLLKPLFTAIESWTLSTASRLNVVSEGFLPYFESRYPKLTKVVFTNGIDEEFLLHQPSTSSDGLRLGVDCSSTVEVLYAGNIGEGQGLHHILPALALALEDTVHFRVIGAGGRLLQLEKAIELAECTNISIESPIGRNELIKAYKRADVLFLHLNEYDAFLKVLPSKLFEYGALGKPILAGVAGTAASFIDQYLENAKVFQPCDLDSAVEAFGLLDLNEAPRPEFVKKFARKGIMNKMAEDVISTGNTL